MSNQPDNQVRFEAHERDFVQAIARKYLRDDDDVADVTQEALLNAFRYRASFRGESRFTTWLYRVTVTTALMYLRKRRRFPAATSSLEPVGDEAELASSGPSPEDEISGREALSRVGERLRFLGDNYAAIFRMRFADGCSESEIASRLGVRVSTVKNRTLRGRAHLREHLKAA
jgi:RNA polymerase sigma-70 factor (ECF subfamily)